MPEDLLVELPHGGNVIASAAAVGLPLWTSGLKRGNEPLRPVFTLAAFVFLAASPSRSGGPPLWEQQRTERDDNSGIDSKICWSGLWEGRCWNQEPSSLRHSYCRKVSTGKTGPYMGGSDPSANGFCVPPFACAKLVYHCFECGMFRQTRHDCSS